MKKSVILFSVLILLSLNVTALGQDEEVEDYGRDVLEINLFGGIDGPTGDMLEWSDSLGAKTGYNYGLDVGYFVNERVVGGFGFRYAEYGIDASDVDELAGDLKHRGYTPSLYAKYYLFPASNISPYLKSDVGLTFLKFTTWVANDNGDRYRQLSYDPAFSFSVGGGAFMYTSDYGGFFAEANYHYVGSSSVEANYEGGTYVFGDNLSSFDIRAGIRILIGSGN